MIPEGFDWDDRKAQRNRSKHGVTFEEAVTVFQDKFALVHEDSEHSWSEARLIIIGSSSSGRVLLVVHMDLEATDVRYRIISARKATPRERSQYESQRISTT